MGRGRINHMNNPTVTPSRMAEDQGLDPLSRIAAALERLAPSAAAAPDFTAAQAFVWHSSPDRLVPVAHVSRVDIALLIGVDRSRDTLLNNTRYFAQGLSA